MISHVSSAFFFWVFLLPQTEAVRFAARGPSITLCAWWVKLWGAEHLWIQLNTKIHYVLALRVGEWVWWLRGTISHSVSQHSFKGKSWLTGRFKFFEGVDKHVAEGDPADVMCWDFQNSFSETSYQRLMEKVNCHEVEVLWFEREATQRKDLTRERAYRWSCVGIHARNCDVQGGWMPRWPSQPMPRHFSWWSQIKLTVQRCSRISSFRVTGV